MDNNKNAYRQAKVDLFLQQDPDLTFYAYNCNAEHAQVNLCFNTQQAFEDVLSRYYSDCQSDEPIRDVKYNTGGWLYQLLITWVIQTDYSSS